MSLNEFKYVNARSHLGRFSRIVNSDLIFKPYHVIYYKILHLFAQRKIKKLIITMPPQHGKSEGSTRNIPAYMFGLYPDLKIAIGSYSSKFAQDFNRDLQRIIDNDKYKKIFPDTRLNATDNRSEETGYLRNATIFEITGFKGSLRAVGRGGPLTGKRVDVMILDDIYKDAEEANSPVTRESAWNWFTKVVQKRLRNSSQELIVFTRWHEDDIIGRLEKLGEVVEVNSWEELESVPKDKYIKINFEALKESDSTEFDPRQMNEPLWEEEFSLEKLEKDRKLDPHGFNCLNQGKPQDKSGQLYDEFKEYSSMPDMVLERVNCTDTADMGDDYLCSISYNKVRYKFDEDERERIYLFVTDIIFTQEGMENTEPLVALSLDMNNVVMSHIESNNGGRGFARNVKSKIKGRTKVVWFHQSKNKESRIRTNATTVNDRIVMPIGWKDKYAEAYRVVSSYKRLFKANKTHDISDVLTMMVEKSIDVKKGSGVRRRN